MALQLDRYALAKDPSTLIFLPYTWGGERHNNESFLKRLAVMSGALVVGAQTPGTGRFLYSPHTVMGMRPGRFPGFAAEYADEVNEFMQHEGLPTRLLAARSGRAVLGAHMQLSRHPFTHTLFVDGANLQAPESAVAGFRRLLAQPSEPERGNYDDARRSMTHRLRDVRAAGHMLTEAAVQGALQCSTIGPDALRALASDPTTPMTNLTFEHGISGVSSEDQALFADELTKRRSEAAAGYAETGYDPAPLHAKVIRGDHADLRNPVLLHEHVQLALGATQLDAVH